MTKLTYGATELILNCDPVRGDGQIDQRHQPLGRYSDGSVVTYDKSDQLRREHVLPFIRLDGVTLAALLDFIATVQGVRYTFTWTDHLAVVRQVKFASSTLEHRQTGPDRYEATVILIEREAL